MMDACASTPETVADLVRLQHDADVKNLTCAAVISLLLWRCSRDASRWLLVDSSSGPVASWSCWCTRLLPHCAAIGQRRLLLLLLSWMGQAGPGLKGPLMHPNMGIRSMASAECTSSRRAMHDLVQVALGHLQVMVQQWNWRHVQRPRQGMLQRSPLLKQTRHLAPKLLVRGNGGCVPRT